MPILMLIAAACAAVAHAGEAAARPETQVARARSLLDAWHAEAPEPGDRRLHVIA